MKKLMPVLVALLCVLVLGFSAIACAEVSNKVLGRETLTLDASGSERTITLHFVTNLEEDLVFTFTEGIYSGLKFVDGDLVIPANWSGKCKFTVEDGSEDKVTTTLTVRPAAPELTLAVGDGSITATWTEVSGISGYVLNWWQTGKKETTLETKIFDSTVTTYIMSGLDEDFWNVELYAYTEDSTQQWSVDSDVESPAPVKVAKAGETKLNNILNAENSFVSYSEKAQTVTLSAKTADSAKITYELVKCLPIDDVELDEAVLTIPAKYVGVISIKATAAATTTYAETVKNFLICVKPAAPTLTALRTGATTAELSWTDVDKALGYTVSYGLKEDLSDAQKIEVDKTDKTATLENLKPGCTYYIKVAADLSYGDGEDHTASTSVASDVKTVVTPAGKEQNTIENFEDKSYTASTEKDQYFFPGAYTADEADIIYVSNDCPVETERGTKTTKSGYTIPKDYSGKFTVTAIAKSTTTYARTKKTISISVNKGTNTIENFVDYDYTVSSKDQYYFGGAYTDDEADITYYSLNCPVTTERGTKENGTYTIPADYDGIFTITAVAAATTEHSETELTIIVAPDGKVTSFKVTKAGKSLNLDGRTIKMKRGTTQKVVAKNFQPTTAEDTRVSFKSSKPSVARVTSSGLIKARKAGTCLITVTAKDGGGASVSFWVKVYTTKKSK